MKSFDEIMLLLEPMLSGLNKVIQLIEKEPDIEENQKKKALVKMLRHWQEEFEETRDGKFETDDANLISEAEINGALETRTDTENPPPGFEDDFGVNPTDFDTPDPDDVPPDPEPDDSGDDYEK